MSAPTPEERATRIMCAKDDAQRRANAEREIRAAEAEALREAKRIVEVPENTREDAARILGEEADRREG